MSISSIGSGAGVYAGFGSSGSGGGFGQDLQALLGAVDSGDRAAIQDAYSKITAQAKTGGDGQDPVGQMLSAIGAALDSGDIGAAQNAVAAFKNAAPPSGAGGPPPPPPGPPPASEAVSDSLQSLVDALSDSDLDDAQSAFTTLSGALSGTGDGGAGYDPMATLVGKLGDAISSGDTSTAQSYLSELMQHLPAGSLVDTSA
ncbi:hypothetical protein [Solimonas variicoloris]|uniref:hypothetical protein n=1 Tax=Solimonas variicoloris TaxID=254408 RepID=UPI00036D85AA|nr:hypothetical protein [Solimonas variicoloris]